jgi:hypothetical protein
MEKLGFGIRNTGCRSKNIKFTVVERPDPKGLSTFSRCTEFPPYSPPDLEIGDLT